MKTHNSFKKSTWIASLVLLFSFAGFVACEVEDDTKNEPSSQNTNPNGNKPSNQGTTDNNSNQNQTSDDTQNSIAKQYNTGYVDDDFTTIEADINLEVMELNDESIFADKHLPPSKDLTDQLPPVFDQGTHTTCVACAVGYYGRTFLWGREKGLSKNQLAMATNQFSPKDLFVSIEQSKKGKGSNGDCWGTSFDAAFDILENRGIVTLADCPYDNFTDCDYNPDNNRSKAANYKIATRRKINLNAKEIKSYLAMGKVVLFAAKVGTNFDKYNGGVFSLDGPDAGAAGHAMTICGYDDNMGPNGAFKVINSYGSNWGDNGFVWIDQKFFCESKDFVKQNPIIMDSKAAELQVDENNTIVDKVDGWDLVPQEFKYYDLDDPAYPEDSEDPTPTMPVKTSSQLPRIGVWRSYIIMRMMQKRLDSL